MPIPEVIDYLCSIVEKEGFVNGSIYHFSPFSFIYCPSQAYADGGADGLKPILEMIKKYLLNNRNIADNWGNNLENAMVTLSLINCGYKGIEVDRANLLQEQKADGVWPKSASFAGIPELFYGFNYCDNNRSLVEVS